MKLYFVRHGESEANLLYEFSNTGFKHPLTANGRAQAKALAALLEKELAGEAVAMVYSSPVMRAAQTARIAADRLGAPLEVTEALREWSVGIYEGTTDPEGWALHRRVQEDWFVKGDHEARMPGGESYNEIYARFAPFIEGLVSQWHDTDRRFVLVGHGGLYLAMLPALFDNISHAAVVEQGFPYTGCVIAEPQGGGLRCLSWCGVAPESFA